MYCMFFVFKWALVSPTPTGGPELKLKSGCLHGWCVDESPAASSHIDLFQSTGWSRATFVVDESCWVICV